MSGSISIPAVAPAAPSFRACCIVGFSRVIDPSALGKHRYGGHDAYGLVFSDTAGFLDLGHIRDNADNTKYYVDQLRSGKNLTGSSFPSVALNAKATVNVKAPIAPAKFIATARSMAYDDSVYHELDSWFAPGDVSSSFSPEDMTSNHIGTWIGATALTDMKAAGNTYEDQMTIALDGALKALGAKSSADTQAQIANTYARGWFKESNKATFWPRFLFNEYLLRRNFTLDAITPWFPYTGPYPALPAGLTHSWGTIPPARTYEITYAHGEALTTSLTTADFTTELGVVKAAAFARFGATYDNP